MAKNHLSSDSMIEITKSQKSRSILENFKFPLSGWIILIHEVLERLSFYGTKTILTLYINLYLGFSDDMATIIYHLFQGLAYFAPVIGAIIADNYLGRFRTVLIVGIIYFIGHLIMTLTAISKNIPGPLIGMIILAFGAGGIKSSVAAFGGDQLPEGKPKMVEKYFSLFYTAINIGAFVGTFITPILRKDVSCVDDQCYPLAFGVPAVIFFITFLIFLLGKRTYKITDSSKNVITEFFGCLKTAIVNWWKTRKIKRFSSLLDYAQTDYSQIFINDCKKAWKIIIIFSPLTIFWALYDQQGSRWTLQAKNMDGRLSKSFIMKPEQIQAFNPLLIIIFIPIFDFIFYPLCNKFNLLKMPTSRLVLAYLITALAFTVTGLLQISIERGLVPHYLDNQSKIIVSNLIENDDINLYIHSSLYNIKNGSHITVDVNSGKNNLSIFNNGTIKEFDFNIDSNQYKSIFIFQANNFTDIIERNIQFTNDKSKGYLRFVSKSKHPSNQSVIVKRTDNIHVNNTYQNIAVGFYSIICSNSKPCGYIEVVPGLIGSIVEISENKYILIREFEPQLIHMLCQLPQYIMMTCAEILCSITALSLAYTEAPDSMKSLMQATYLVTIFGGNIIVVLVASIGEITSQSMEFFFYAILVTLAGFVNWVLIRWLYSSNNKQNTTQTDNDKLRKHSNDDIVLN